MYNITYLPLITYQIYVFIKWKNLKYHAERSKYPFHHGVKIFSFQPEVKGTCIAKKSHPGVKFYPGVKFTSPTCNMPLSFKSFCNSWGNSYSQPSGVNNLVPIHMWWKEIVLKREKVYIYFVQDCSNSKQLRKSFF